MKFNTNYKGETLTLSIKLGDEGHPIRDRLTFATGYLLPGETLDVPMVQAVAAIKAGTAVEAGTQPVEAPDDAPDKPKRFRRTKAQMEEARAQEEALKTAAESVMRLEDKVETPTDG